MLDLLIASLILLLLYNALLVIIKAIAAKETDRQNDDQESGELNPVQALHCLESFNPSCNDLSVLADCIKTLDDSSLSELSGYSLKYTKDKETKKIIFKEV